MPGPVSIDRCPRRIHPRKRLEPTCTGTAGLHLVRGGPLQGRSGRLLEQGLEICFAEDVLFQSQLAEVLSGL